jgi:hypothetical protein
MATVISRLFTDAAGANKAAKTFERARFPRKDLRVVAMGEGDTAASVTDKMVGLGMAAGTAKAYAAKMSDGAAAFVVKATYKPLTAKTIAREILDAAPTVDMGKVEEENWVKDAIEPMSSVLDDHPRFFTRPPSAKDRKGPVTKGIMPLLSKRKPLKSSVISGGKKMSFWPMPLLREGRITKPRLRKDGPVTARLPFPLLSGEKRDKSVISGGKLIVEENLGIPSVIRR